MQYLEILIWLDKLKQANRNNKALLEQFDTLYEVLSKTDDAQETLDKIVTFLKDIAKGNINYPNMLSPGLTLNQLLTEAGMDAFKNSVNSADKEVFNLFVKQDFKSIEGFINLNLSQGAQNQTKMEQNIRWLNHFGSFFLNDDRLNYHLSLSSYWLSTLKPTEENLLKTLTWFSLTKTRSEQNTFALLDLIAKNAPNFKPAENIAFSKPLESITKEYMLKVVETGGHSQYDSIIKFDRLNIVKHLLDKSSPLGARMEQNASSDGFLSGFIDFRDSVEALFLNEPKMDKTQLGEFYLNLYTRDLIKNASASNKETGDYSEFYRQRAKAFLKKKPFHYLAAKTLYEANSSIDFVKRTMSKHADKYAEINLDRNTVSPKLTPDELVLLGKINMRTGDRAFVLRLFFSDMSKVKFVRNEIAPLIEAHYSTLNEDRQKKFRMWIQNKHSNYQENLALLPTICESITQEVKEEKRVAEELRLAKEIKIAEEKKVSEDRERQEQDIRFAQELEQNRVAFERQLEKERQVAENTRLAEEKDRVAREERLAKEQANAVKTIDETWFGYRSAINALQINGLDLNDANKPQDITELPALKEKTKIVKQIMTAQTQFEKLKIVSQTIFDADEKSDSPLQKCDNVDELTDALLKHIVKVNESSELKLLSLARTMKRTCSDNLKTLSALEKEIKQLQTQGKGTSSKLQDSSIAKALSAMEKELNKKVFDPVSFLSSLEDLKYHTDSLPQLITDATTKKSELYLEIKEKLEDNQRIAEAKIQYELQADAKKKADLIWSEFENVVELLREQGYRGATEERPSVDEQKTWDRIDQWIGRYKTVVLAMEQFHVLEVINQDLQLENTNGSPLTSCEVLSNIDSGLLKTIKAMNEQVVKTLRGLAYTLREESTQKSKRLSVLQKEISDLEKQDVVLAQDNSEASKSLQPFQQVVSNHTAADNALVKAVKKNTLDASFSEIYLNLQKINTDLAVQIKHAEEIIATLTQSITERVTNLSEEDKQLLAFCDGYVDQFKGCLSGLEELVKTLNTMQGNHGVILKPTLLENIKKLQDPLMHLTNELGKETKRLRFSVANKAFDRILRMRSLIQQCTAFAKTNPLDDTLSQLRQQVKHYVEAREKYQNEAKSIGETLFNALENVKQTVEKDMLKADKRLTSFVEKLFITIQLNGKSSYFSFFVSNPWDEVYTKETLVAHFAALANSDNPLNLHGVKTQVDTLASDLQQKIAQQKSVEIKQPEPLKEPELIKPEIKVSQVTKAQSSIKPQKPKKVNVAVLEASIKPPEVVEDKKDLVAANDPSMPEVEATQGGWLDWLIPEFVLRWMDTKPKASQEVLPQQEQMPSVQPVLSRQPEQTVYVPEDYGVSASELGYSAKKPSLWSQFVTWFTGLFAREEKELPQEKPEEVSLPRQEVTPKRYSPPRESNSQSKPVNHDMITRKGRFQVEDDNHNARGPK